MAGNKLKLIQMEATYFKTNKAFYHAVAKTKKEGFEVNVCALSCACGETTGALVYSNGKLIEKSILCTSCYKSASFHQRGE